MEPSNYRSSLKNARGLGSAHEGTHHFWIQRMSALALIPLSVWFVISLVSRLIGADREAVANWLHSPIIALLMAIFVLSLFLHARLGVQTIIEDYVHGEAKKLVSLVLSNGLNLLLCAASVFAIARLYFVGM
jgi:succinate dehydrogenase / fumarate reductase, membrane anchor subunit